MNVLELFFLRTIGKEILILVKIVQEIILDGRGLDKLASQDALGNFLGNTLGLYWDGIYSDKNKSKEVWFWEIK